MGWPVDANYFDFIHIHRIFGVAILKLPRNVVLKGAINALKHIVFVRFRFGFAYLSKDFRFCFVSDFNNSLAKYFNFILIWLFPNPKESLTAWRDQLDCLDSCSTPTFIPLYYSPKAGQVAY